MSAPDLQAINYPDLLGYVTGGERLNINLIQCAITTRPDHILAGQSFEVLLLIQNMTDVDVDVTLEMKLPDKDHKNQRGMFFSKSSRLLVGLQPAEVGYITLPASCSPKTAPGEDYPLLADVKVDRADRGHKPVRVRENDGGSAVTLDVLSDEKQETLRALRSLTWSAEHQPLRNQRLKEQFSVQPAGVSGLAAMLKPDWVSLWTLRDYLDEKGLEDRVQEHLAVILPPLADKEAMFKTLYAKTNEVFKKADYPLQAAEAVFIAKVMTLVLCEVGVPQPTRTEPHPQMPRWYKKLVQLLFQEPRFRDYPERVITTQLYYPLLKDSIQHAFRMVETVRKERFGSPEEIEGYIADLTDTLQAEHTPSYGQVSFPLLVAGVIANSRVVMPNENIRNTLNMLHKAMQKRQPEHSDDNQFVTDMLNEIIDMSFENL